MKFVGILLSLFVQVSANAKCSFSGISCWPSSSVIKANGIIVIDFFGYSQNLVQDLNKKYPIYLKGGNEVIKLMITETLKGEFQLTQIVLKPETRLTAGVKYEMVVDNLPKEHVDIKQWEPTTKKRVWYSWTAIAEVDLQAPQWTSLPSYSSKSYMMFGCGPAQSINFTLSANDLSEVLVKTTVRSVITGKTSSYYLIPKNETVAVGHGMCSGAFRFNEGKDYEIMFSLIDASGNTTCENTTTYKLSRPEISDGG